MAVISPKGCAFTLGESIQPPPTQQNLHLPRVTSKSRNFIQFQMNNSEIYAVWRLNSVIPNTFTIGLRDMIYTLVEYTMVMKRRAISQSAYTNLRPGLNYVRDENLGLH